MAKNGVPKEQIILLSFDDVAKSQSNWKHHGKLYNKPAKVFETAFDVYNGCNIDYRGDDVTASKLLKILKGDSSVGGKYLKSNEKSKIFFYYADHGAPGMVAMPFGEPLYAW